MNRIALSALAGAALLASGASAQKFQTVKPLSGIKPVSLQPIAPVNLKPPRFYTKHELAMQVSKLMDLPAPLAIGEPVSFGPDRLAVPGLVSASIIGAKRVTGYASPQQDGGTGVAIMTPPVPAGAISFSFLAQKGKRYAIACSAISGEATYAYQLSGGMQVTGGVSPDENLQAIFATGAAPAGGWADVTLGYAKPNLPVDIYFYGCEIAPF